MFDFIDRFDGNLEEVKKHIKVEYTYLDDEREKAFMESVEKTCKEYNEIIEKINKKHGNKRI
jgi:ppGpp synthetase/RelA/SpoT-type nucleotidyltranferase